MMGVLTDLGRWFQRFITKACKHTWNSVFQKLWKITGVTCRFIKAQGDFVVTMDADLQDSPEEIPSMIAQIKEKNLDLISGWKKKRYDSILFKNYPPSSSIGQQEGSPASNYMISIVD